MGDITERIDNGPVKSKEYIVAEYDLTKLQAIDCHRESRFNLLDLKNMGVTDEELDKVRKDHFQGAIVKENYDEEWRKNKGAVFVKPEESAKKE